MEKEAGERKQSLNESAIIKTNTLSADVVFFEFFNHYNFLYHKQSSLFRRQPMGQNPPVVLKRK